MKEYVRVEIKTTEFEAEDVITTSNHDRREYETFQMMPMKPTSQGTWW